MPSEWLSEEHATAYLAIKNEVPQRAAGESTLLAELPKESKRILDLGCGDGHLLKLVLQHCPDAVGVGLDFSPAMLRRAREQWHGDDRVQFVEHDLEQPLSELGTFDAVVSSFAIHHCPHRRKRELYQEVFDRLNPGGFFCNLEHVASPNDNVHAAFMKAISEIETGEDPSNQLLDVETQLQWLRNIGFEDVDCYWKWRELGLLIGKRSVSSLKLDESQEFPLKQVIVMRHDLKMRRGKQIAQGAHASMSFLANRLRQKESVSLNELTVDQQQWLKARFAKICCRVNSEEELLAIHDAAVEAGLEVHLIVDSGKTEFHGQPTKTCLAIGPDRSDRIDAITGHLELL
ncbi:Trans-aconitate 2-methyltransferase [Thalassoglobus neptunius]|uniref:peptidyl-tRNA hydrolase n=1 Tax=Thalassoglobus neptunius TaxID=1938619 RepID=A0A5C5W089_9PLAN|nr:aminoacyl-tRNA hydrolase [Thalassoglobus neptunius]TWT43585.1 Trans-aconitate 2-methyltransferase [Thalassoglobus neptunius]